jgi:hypothetical protein
VISVTPKSTIQLRHRAVYVVAAETGEIVSLSKEGVGTLVAPDRWALGEFELGSRIEGAAIHPHGKLLALAEEGGVSLVSLPDLVEQHRVEGVYQDCRFSPSGQFLWVTQAFGEKVVLEVHDTKSWQQLGRIEMPDPFGDSGLMLFPYPNETHIALWIAAGQDGQCLYWATCVGRHSIAARRLAVLDDTAPPAFDRSGKRFLVTATYDVRLYEFPNGPELGRVPWPLEEDPPAEIIYFVDDDRAIVNSNEGRLFLIDVRQMKTVEEITIVGHEPRPSLVRLPHNDPVSSDLMTFMPLPGGKWLSVHHSNPGQPLANWRDSLLIWNIPNAQGRDGALARPP